MARRLFVFFASVFSIFVILFAVIITVVNDGNFTYVLDDPLIHLSLAQNILDGQYGINYSQISVAQVEPSAPASSILWPLLIAPLTLFSSTNAVLFALLALNLVISLLAIYLLCQFVVGCLVCDEASLSFTSKKKYSLAKVLLLFLVLASNLFALVFVGMEHNLHVLVSLYLLLSLCFMADAIESGERYKLGGLFWLLVVVSPLIRYEGILFSGIALLFVFFESRAHRVIAVAAGIVMLGLLASFSVFLHEQGLGYLPTSISLKSDVHSDLSVRLIEKLHQVIVTPKAWGLLLVAALLLRKVCVKGFLKVLSTPSENSWQRLYFLLALSFIAFVFVGSFGWYYRYEAFVWLVTLVIAIKAYWEELIGFFEAFHSAKIKHVLLTVVVMVGVNCQHIAASLLVPISANNVYLQQFQIARFVHDYWQGNIAVNDIGWVSFENDVYVLDLWGLASKQALELRHQHGLGDGLWMQELTEAKNVELVAIYYNDQGEASGWFEDVPDSWVHLGALTMQAMGITVARRDVQFFAVGHEAAVRAKPKLKQFAQTLPELTAFEWQD